MAKKQKTVKMDDFGLVQIPIKITDREALRELKTKTGLTIHEIVSRMIRIIERGDINDLTRV